MRHCAEVYSARILARLYLADPSAYLALMNLTEDDLQEFREIWRKEFDEPITAEDARQRAIALLDLYVLLSSPEPEEDA